MTSRLVALLLLLRLLPGQAEAADEEEITEFLYDYASRFGDYLYATVEYYSDNTTLIPTMYPDEELLESLGPPLRCHLPLLVLLALLRLLL
ncbi:hypothetical protein AV530_009215 [Patagioenas fasciata monilis]|uniref:Uncharacterized protein n=1 Tax=Patagioenas fasciata monilis TaxID=372326 RepID=A0A1V4KMG7_PATFA|nr:hypothetical protein AV530_009215 [Patagioenas fasciata monilis]